MIKIIKKGTRQQATCDKCGCIFSYEEEDIKHLENHNGEYHFINGTRHGYKNYVICPQCNNDLVINQTRCIPEESEVTE
jgi:Fe2+ or Zn2+ uptake regulation protein